MINLSGCLTEILSEKLSSSRQKKRDALSQLEEDFIKVVGTDSLWADKGDLRRKQYLWAETLT